MAAGPKHDVEAVGFETDSDTSKSKLSVVFVVKAILVRLLLIAHSVVTIWRTTDVLGDKWYWLLAIANILLVVDGLYSVFKLKGQERKW